MCAHQNHLLWWRRRSLSNYWVTKTKNIFFIFDWKKHKFLKNILSLQPNWQGKMVVELMTKEKIIILVPFMVIILYGETTIKELCCRLLFLLIELQKYTMYLYPGYIWPLQILSCHSIYQYLIQFMVGWLFALGLDKFTWEQKVNPILHRRYCSTGVVFV